MLGMSIKEDEMKVEGVGFAPITITIETQEELDTIFSLLNISTKAFNELMALGGNFRLGNPSDDVKGAFFDCLDEYCVTS